jgi:hypothetical protein
VGRLILAILAGVAAAFATIWAIEMVHHLLYPIPGDLRLHDTARLAEHFRTLPMGSQLFIAAGWLAGAAVGGIVAARISRRRKAAWWVAGIVALAAIANVLFIPHPLFLMLSAVAAPLLGGLIARALGGPDGASRPVVGEATRA